ncbi:MAG TPA: endonuclease/exonuclease/phosphatase family protein [Pseudonocardiaceae bacterium]|nr:endonuclease/exonuclease/phosphatase family protein [Pseudonocardiaceae bacterium]
MTTAEQDQQEDGHLRILHWNIHSWRDPSGSSNLDAIAGLVRQADPHVVSLVEVDEPWGMPDALQELAARTGYAWVFVPSFEFGDQAPAGGFGNALLTTLPILAVQQWQLLWPAKRYDGTEPSEARSVVFAKLGFAHSSVWCGGTHLPRSDARARMNALHRLTSLTQKLDSPWLLCGDFNTPAESWIDRNSSVVVCPEPARPTYPAHEPVEPIDYCVASPGLQVEGEVLEVGGSDHLPVVFWARATGGG